MPDGYWRRCARRCLSKLVKFDHDGKSETDPIFAHIHKYQAQPINRTRAPELRFGFQTRSVGDARPVEIFKKLSDDQYLIVYDGEVYIVHLQAE